MVNSGLWGNFAYPPCLEIFFDGSSLGNPGAGGAGVTISLEGEEKRGYARYLGDNVTNNQAEYRALIIGLDKAIDMIKRRGFSIGVASLVIVNGDSNVVINQMNGSYQARHLEDLHEEAWMKVEELESLDYDVQFNHIRRENNKEADRFAREGANLRGYIEKAYRLE